MKADFLKKVLGKDGAAALSKAIDKSKSLEKVFLPRVVMSWTALAHKYNYKGSIPGIEGSSIEFIKKSDGSLDVKIDSEEFKDTTLFNTAAYISLSLGAESGLLDDKFRDLDLTRLGKSVDVLVKYNLIKTINEK